MPRSKTRAHIRAAARTAREIRGRLGLRDEVKARQAVRLGEEP